VVDGVLYPEVVPFARPAGACVRDPFRMLALGRITRNKRLDETVALLERLRADGVPATLEIVGRANTPYARRFLRRYRSHPHIELSPDAGRDALARALARARIGIHPFRGEHFGIGVAEMLCAGVLPVVHNSGGCANWWKIRPCGLTILTIWWRKLPVL
jgi:glycosyltransferase involved in cell wall biosynthesis